MTDPTDLRGRTAIVTGASSGIGRAIAAALGAAGARVELAGRTARPMEETAKALEKRGGLAGVTVLDLREPGAIEALVERVVAEAGGLQIFVSSAGLAYRETIAEGDPEHWREMLEVNVLALLAGARAAIRAMRRTGSRGHLVNVSSMAGRMEASGVYGATKAAVDSIATTLFKELEDEPIQVVNVVPGGTISNFASTYDPAAMAALVKSAGFDVETGPGTHLPDEVLDAVQRKLPDMMVRAEDVARAVLFAVSQPIEVDVFEIAVRPSKQYPL